jgi:hypothetical protein
MFTFACAKGSATFEVTFFDLHAAIVESRLQSTHPAVVQRFPLKSAQTSFATRCGVSGKADSKGRFNRSACGFRA